MLNDLQGQWILIKTFQIEANTYIRGFTKFGIKVLWKLQFLENLKTLRLKFQKDRTKIGVFLTVPS